MNKLISTVLVLGLAGSPCLAQGDATKARKQDKPAPQPEKQASANPAYLGLAVFPALRSQLPTVLPKDEGVMIREVVPDSPAAKAGLKPDDILLTFGNKKLSSPRQLTELVRGDHPGQQVAIDFVRGGKIDHCKVTLGEHEQPVNLPRWRHIFHHPRPHWFGHHFTTAGKHHDDDILWKSFDALTLTRQDAKHWRAEISYRSKDGNKEHKVFEGTREQIRKDILAAKDLPANERHHLLQALNPHPPIFDFHFPRFGRWGHGFWGHL